MKDEVYLNTYHKIKDYDVVLVDLDNTIFDYSRAHRLALNSVISEFIDLGITEEEYERANIQIKMRSLKANHHKKELYFKVIQENLKLPLSFALEASELYESEFLKNLKADRSMLSALTEYKNKQNGLIIAVTDFYCKDQLKKLKETNLLSLIDYMVTSEEFEEEKPSIKLTKHVYSIIESNINFSNKTPKRTHVLMVGDSTKDEKFAKKSGFDYLPYNCSKIIIGISGKSGAGKSTLTEIISEVMDACVIEGDGYHKYDRFSEMWKSLTHYDPHANNLVKLGLDVRSVFHDIGEVNIPIYNHSTGLFDDDVLLKTSADTFIIDGLHTLYPEVAGNYINFKIFLENDFADEQKLNRDCLERGKSESSVNESIRKRDEDYSKYIQSQKEHSNILIQSFADGAKKMFKITVNGDIIMSNRSITGEYSVLKDTLRELFVNIRDSRFV